MFDAIKLFGRRIAVPEAHAVEEVGDWSESSKQGDGEHEKDQCLEAIAVEVKDLSPDDSEEIDCIDLDAASDMDTAKNSHKKDENLVTELHTEKEKEQKVSGHEKVMKKPDKILPCPRCNSMDTKFCYFNNYNVNQPRHFCKNCQRYWTAGGTMRNVPVGAGRRKNKHSSSQYRHMMTVSEGPSSQIDSPDSSHCHSVRQFNGNRTVLKFGQETQICDSMTNSLNLTEHRRQTDSSVEACGDNGKVPACTSSRASPNPSEKEIPENTGQVNQNAISDACGNLIPMHPIHCYPTPPWALHWSPGWNAAAAAAAADRSVPTVVNGQESGNPNQMAWSLPPMMTAPAFVAPPIPIPLIPTSFWGCMTSWPPGAWNAYSMGANGFPVLPPSTENNEHPGIHSPRLGKHSRDSVPQVEEKVEKSLWVPKTLRIDDPEEAAKSSIWATLGIKHDQNDALAKGGIFKSFQQETNEKSLQPESQFMHANPAALSRSQTFQEST